MAVHFSRTDSGGYRIEDTRTGESRLFDSEQLFYIEALKLITENTRRMEESIDRLYAMLSRGEAPAPEIEVWPS